ncbi:hypothetical protein HY623_01785 [Candidatus Uhrbacteria bacterium]|nr:hypothetical protein [Candidatus Uhrbacteria bacterium]
MKKIISTVLLFSLIFGTIGVGALPASAQPLNYATVDATVSFSGSGRTLTIRAGSTADSLLIGTTNMTVSISSGQTFTVRDTGTTNSTFRKIDVSDGTTTGCASGNVGSEVIISIGTGTRTVIITPTDISVSCNAVAVAAGGGGGGGTTTTTTTTTTEQTAEQKAAADVAAKAAADKKATDEKVAQEKTAEATLQPVTVKTVDVAVTDTKQVQDVATGVTAADLGVGTVTASNLTVKKTGEATKEIAGEKPTIDKQIKAALEKDARDDTAKKALTDVRSAVSLGSLKALPTSTKVESFTVSDKTSGKSVSVSKVSQSVQAKETLQNVKILVTIPKDVAKSASELTFPGLKPTIIQDDPIVEWTIAELKAGEQAELSYQVNKKIESIDTKVVATASAPISKETVFVFKDGKFVAVSKEEAARIEAEAAASAAAKAPAQPEEKAPISEKQEKPVSIEVPSPQAVAVARAKHIDDIVKNEAPALASALSVAAFLEALNHATGQALVRNEAAEDKTISDILPKLNIDLKALLAAARLSMAAVTDSNGKPASIDGASLERIVAYITYGTPTTLKIGAGERAGVLNSYIAACGKVPSKEGEWADLLKIAGGRFPAGTCDLTKERAGANFKRVYKRDARKENANDQAALTIMQYGLLPVKAVKVGEGAAVVPNRDTQKEKQAILAFKKIFGYYPSTATAWNVVRAIAYSGTQR